MKKYPLLLLLLCISAALKAQTDTVTAKINKIPIIHVDVLAKFPGGDFTKYIAGNIYYQKKSDRSLRGQVIISLKIDTNGKVSNVNVLKSVTPQIDQEVVHVIKSSPKWHPGMLESKPVGVYMVFNIDMGVISALAPAVPAKPAVVSVPEIVKKPVIEPITTGKKTPATEKKPEATPLINDNKANLKAVKKPVPPFDKKPVPVEKKPTTQVIKKAVILPVAKKPEPIVVKKAVTAPIVKKTPLPPPVKKAEPVLIKKPAIAPIVKTPPSPVKKAEPAVAKKPVIAPIAKKTTPPPVKKAEPVVVKKPVAAPVAKTPPPAVKKAEPQTVKTIIKPARKKPAAEPVIKHKILSAKNKQKATDDGNQILGPSSEAQFPNGGLPAFFKYLSENIHYPILSKINRIEGEVTLTFVVDKDGTVTDVKIVSAPAEDLAQEAKRVILAAPKWKPAMQNGVAIKEAFTVPINFKFQDKQSQP